jgi:DNA adenine methylase
VARTNSPLRYPGGKSTLTRLTGQILHINALHRGHYAEPYAGGCGLALSLLFGGYVGYLHLNDADPAVWAFWNSVLTRNAELAERVRQSPVTMEEWHRQRAIYRGGEAADPLDLGFSLFFLNRTNRSGVINGGGVIGGKNQNGTYKLDCRWNREDLAERIERVGKYSARIALHCMDAEDFMRQMDADLPARSLIFADPPYFAKGADLYANYYAPEDHARVRRTIAGLTKPWVVTYDDVPDIRRIWHRHRQFGFSVSYSVHQKRQGAEIMIPSSRLKLPDGFRERQLNLWAQPVSVATEMGSAVEA